MILFKSIALVFFVVLTILGFLAFAISGFYFEKFIKIFIFFSAADLIACIMAAINIYLGEE